MGSAQIVAGVCGELHEAVFDLRQAIPPQWQGEAADGFTERVEEVNTLLVRGRNTLQASIGLIAAHQRHMDALRVLMGRGV